jgi:hypothetical protein
MAATRMSECPTNPQHYFGNDIPNLLPRWASRPRALASQRRLLNLLSANTIHGSKSYDCAARCALPYRSECRFVKSACAQHPAESVRSVSAGCGTSRTTDTSIGVAL